MWLRLKRFLCLNINVNCRWLRSRFCNQGTIFRLLIYNILEIQHCYTNLNEIEKKWVPRSFWEGKFDRFDHEEQNTKERCFSLFFSYSVKWPHEPRVGDALFHTSASVKCTTSRGERMKVERPWKILNESVEWFSRYFWQQYCETRLRTTLFQSHTFFTMYVFVKPR